MIRPHSVELVEATEIELYPIPRDTRLSHYFTMFEHRRWLNSTLRLRGSMAVRGAALELYFIAQDQVPIGTLPEDDDMLARLLMIDPREWAGLRSQPISPLHNWRRCNCDGEIRLMHPVVTEVLERAIAQHIRREAANSDKAVEMRRRRLVKALLDLGCAAPVVADDVLIQRIDDWLLETCKGQRRAVHYERALLHAQRMRWLGGPNGLT